MKSICLAAVVLLSLQPAAGAGAEPRSAQDILAANKAASGGDGWDGIRAIRREGTIQLGDLTGSFTTVVDIAAQRYRSDFEVGPLSQAQVADREQVLDRDQGGQVNRIEAPGDVRSAMSDLYRSILGPWYPERWPARSERLADAEADGKTFLRVAIAPEDAQPFELWIDPKTRLVERIVEQSGSNTVVTRLGDYQPTGGLMLARRAEFSIAGGTSAQVIRTDVIELDPELPDDAFVLESSAADDYRITDGADTVVVPFELFNNHTYLEVHLNGEGPFQFLADTGGRHLLTPQVATALGIETQGEFDIGGAGAKRRTASLAGVERLRVGTLELRDQPFIVLDMSELSSVGGQRIDGLIGYEVFRRFVVEYDYARGELRLHRPENYRYTGDGHRVPFRFSDTTPLIRASIDGHEGDIAIDTGSRSHLSLTTPFARAHDYARKHAGSPTTIIGWGVGGPTIGQVARGQELRIGDELVVSAPLIDFSEDARGALGNPDEIANLGAGLLRQFTLVLDYAGRYIIFEPNERFGTREPADRAGLFLRAVDGGFEVAHVTPGGPGEKAGLETGHLITRIDGRSVDEISLPRLRERWRDEAPGTAFRLDVVHADERWKTTLELEELVP